MRSKIAYDLEQNIYNPYSKRADDFLLSNSFPKMNITVEWLLKNLAVKIKGGKVVKDFAKAVVEPAVKTSLSEGDICYVDLFRQHKFINEETRDRESLTPYREAIGSIYNDLFGDNKVYDPKLVIYSALKECIERKLGKSLASEPLFGTFRQWLLIDNLLEIRHEIRGEWLQNIPLSKIRAEQSKFLLSQKRQPLAAIAALHFSYRDREKAAKHYTANLRKIPKKPVSFSFCPLFQASSLERQQK